MPTFRAAAALALAVTAGAACEPAPQPVAEAHLPAVWRMAHVDPERGGRFLPQANARLRDFQREVELSGRPLPNPHFGRPDVMVFALRSDQPHSERRLRLLLESEADDPDLSFLVLTDEPAERAATRLGVASDVASGRVAFHRVTGGYVSHPSFVFTRDYAPVVRVGRDGAVNALVTYRGSEINKLIDDELGVASRRSAEKLVERAELTRTLRRVEADRLPAPIEEVELDILLDGGNLITDGRGSCFSTRVILAKNGRDETAVSDELREKLGCVRTVFLAAPQRLDRLQHVDTLLAFADPENVILSMPVHYESDLVAELQNMQTLLDLGYRVHRVPRRTASVYYTNLLVTGQKVYVPQFTVYNVESAEQLAMRERVSRLDRVADRDEIVRALRREPGTSRVRGDPDLARDNQVALDVARRVFPDREIVPVNSDETVDSLGSWHCLSHELPAPER